jgi:hypothetical protein
VSLGATSEYDRSGYSAPSRSAELGVNAEAFIESGHRYCNRRSGGIETILPNSPAMPVRGQAKLERRRGWRRDLPWGSGPFGGLGTGGRWMCRFTSPTPSAPRVSHSLSGLIPPGLCGFVSRHIRPEDFGLQSLSLSASRDLSRGPLLSGRWTSQPPWETREGRPLFRCTPAQPIRRSAGSR